MDEGAQKRGTSGFEQRAVRKRDAVVEQMPLTERSAQVVEAGLAEYQRIREHSTRLGEELRGAEKQLHLFEVELNLRDMELSTVRARCAELERIIDRKTGDYAALDAMLHNVKVQLDAFLPARNEQAPAQSSLVPWEVDENQVQAALQSEEHAQGTASAGDD